MTDALDPEEGSLEYHRETIRTLRGLCETWYWMCFKAGVGARAHSFIEWNGVLSKHVELLGRAVEAGHDPHHFNVHSGLALPVHVHDMQYLADKLDCIMGPVIHSDPQAKAAFIRAMGLEQAAPRPGLRTHRHGSRCRCPRCRRLTR